MNTTNPYLEQLQIFQRESQQHDQELIELVRKASALVHDGNTDEGCALYQKAQEKVDVFRSRWEIWICQTPADIPFATSWLQQMSQTKISLLLGKGQAAFRVGRLSEARETYKQALSLLGEHHDPNKASLLQTLGGVCMQQGSFGIAEKYYRDAHSEYFSLAESFSLKDDSYLFNWDQSIGSDSGRLIEFIGQNYGLDWVKTAKIDNIDDGKAIRVYTGKNSLSLKLNPEKTEVNLTIDDGRIGQFFVKTEESQLNIYQFDNKGIAHMLYVEAARTLSYAADNAIRQGNRDGFLRYLDEAIGFAQIHELHDVVRELWFKNFRYRLDTDPTGETLQMVHEELTKIKSLKQDAVFQVDALCLLSRYWRERGNLSAGEKILRNACKLIKDIPHKKWSILQELAEVCESRGDLKEAVMHSEEALSIARKISMPEVIATVLQTLIPLRLMINDDTVQREQAEQEMDELRQKGDNQVLTVTLLLTALTYCKQKQFDLAMKDIQKAEQVAPTPELRHRAKIAMAATLRDMGRKEDALKVNIDAITFLNKQILQGDKSLSEWKSLLSGVEAMYESAAFLAAELGNPRQAFEFADNGKTLRLRSQLAQTEQGTTGADPPSKVTFDEIHDLLAHESSAMVIFCVTGHGTLGLILDPREKEPQHFFIYDLTEAELRKMVPTGQENNLGDVFNNLPMLSKMLCPQLSDIVKHCTTLYIVPDSKLYFVPFAALEFEDGSRLIEHCALAYAPSAAVLRWVRSLRTRKAEHSYLVIGVGDEYLFSLDKIPGDDDGILIKFLEQNVGIDWVKAAKIEKFDDGVNIRVSTEKNSLSLRLDNERTMAILTSGNNIIAAFKAKTENGKQNIYCSFYEQTKVIANLTKAKLLPEATTVEEYMDEAPHFTVLHISCHGRMEGFGTMSASYLQFANQKFSAKDVLNFKGRLSADLVFLNSCTSGWFQSLLGSDVGGFWEAFLHEGVTSLIATLTYVHPVDAHELALGFYREWLNGGVTKAEALRKAQLGMLRKNIEPRNWAPHILVGDHR